MAIAYICLMEVRRAQSCLNLPSNYKLDSTHRGASVPGMLVALVTNSLQQLSISIVNDIVVRK